MRLMPSAECNGLYNEICSFEYDMYVSKIAGQLASMVIADPVTPVSLAKKRLGMGMDWARLRWRGGLKVGGARKDGPLNCARKAGYNHALPKLQRATPTSQSCRVITMRFIPRKNHLLSPSVDTSFPSLHQ